MATTGTGRMSGKGFTTGTGKGSAPTKVVAGAAGKSVAQGPMPGPANPGQPIAMKRALARKPTTSKGL